MSDDGLVGVRRPVTPSSPTPTRQSPERSDRSATGPIAQLIDAAAASAGPNTLGAGPETPRVQRSGSTLVQREPDDDSAASDGSADEPAEPEVSRESIKRRWFEIQEDVKAVMEYPDHHKPTDLASTGKAFREAFKAEKNGEADAALRALHSMVSLAKSFAERLNDIEAQAETVSNEQQQANIVKWVAMHKEFSWEQVVETKDKSREEGSLAHLEARLDTYAQREADATASADAATKRKLDAAKAAREKAAERRRKISEGLLTDDGRSIEQWTTSKLSGEELTAVEATLGVIDGGAAIALTHPNGAKFGATFGNRDGDLPGRPRGGGYLEYYVEKDPSDSSYHGGRRLVKHVATGRVYYTRTHYGDNGSPAFVRIR